LIPWVSDNNVNLASGSTPRRESTERTNVDVYFSADVETDGPIPGPYSILSFALVYAGRFDGRTFERPPNLKTVFYRELKPISDSFDPEALQVNRLNREELLRTGQAPQEAMTEACIWVREVANPDRPVLVAYPLSFDWSWLYWYFISFSVHGSPFGYSRCFDIKTAVAVKERIPIAEAGRNQLPALLRSRREHSHNALDDAIEQAEIFANVFEREALNGGHPRSSAG
jgi:3'-5' exoribonuclease-like protein